MYKTILLPIDLDDIAAAKPAIERATKLASLNGAALRLLNVQISVPASYIDFVPDSFEHELKTQCEDRLKSIAAKMPLPADRVSWVARSGGVYTEILAEATKCGADLIVLGSHRPTMATYLLGSNAQTVTRHARCSVLIARQ